MPSGFEWFISTLTFVLSGVISVYDNYVDTISKMASEGRKTEPSEKSEVNAAIVVEEATIDSSPKQDDGWEKVSETADNGGNWNDFEDDYYSSGDDITVEEYIENGEWLQLEYRKVSHERPLPANPAEGEKEMESPSSETETPAKEDRAKERAKRQQQSPPTTPPSHIRRYKSWSPPPRPLRREPEMRTATAANREEVAVSGSSGSPNGAHSKGARAAPLGGYKPRPQGTELQATASPFFNELNEKWKTIEARIDARVVSIRKHLDDPALQHNRVESSSRNMTFFDPYRYYTY